MSEDRSEVNTLPASRTLDLPVAAGWMGWEQIPEQHPAVDVADQAWILPPGMSVSEVPPGGWAYVNPRSPDNRLTVPEVPPFSTDIAAAWEVIRSMKSYGLSVRLTNGRVDNLNMFMSDYTCTFFPTRDTGRRGTGFAYDAPLAICRAAIDAL